jgi:type II secretory pathway pseudopilin PulG
MFKKPKKSFTLTEVLIVTSVIAIVTSFVFALITGRRAEGRDTKRYAEVDTLRTALEYYYYDNKEYPQVTDWIKIEEDADAEGPFSQIIKPEYLPQIPRDPLYPEERDGKVFSYQYKSADEGQEYKIHIELEGGGFYEVYSGGGKKIVYIPGGEPGASMRVGTTNSIEGLLGSYQRKSFYANGRYWIFYCDNNNFKYASSPDGINWSFQDIGLCFLGEGFNTSVFFDGNYVHYARAYLGFSCELYYRRGIPENDGTITWSASEQMVYDGSTFNRYETPNIAVDTNGYAWIGTKHYSSNLPYVFKNANNNGTWSTDVGFPYQLSSSLSLARPIIVPLTNGKMYAVYANNSAPPRGQLWNGSSWESEETNIADYVAEGPTNRCFAITATNNGDDIYFAYLRESTSQIRFNKRDYNTGWQIDELIQDNVETDTFPVISINAGSNETYVFWAGVPTANHIYYKKRAPSGVWDYNPTDWIDEAGDGLPLNYTLTGYLRDYGLEIGLAYLAGLSSPYNIRLNTF